MSAATEENQFKMSNLQFEDNTAPEVTIDPRNDLNSTQMNALLNIRDNQFNIVLQSVYFSKKCSCFYVCLLLLAVILIVVTCVEGMHITKNPLFIICEFLVNSLITVDYCFRLKLAGFEKFFRSNRGRPVWRNVMDTVVVGLCNVMFLVAIILPHSVAEEAFDGLAETFLVVWCIFSIVRMVMIAKNHQIAKQNAQTLINFENIVVDTEFGGGNITNRSSRIQGVHDDNVLNHEQPSDIDYNSRPPKQGMKRSYRANVEM